MTDEAPPPCWKVNINQTNTRDPDNASTMDVDSFASHDQRKIELQSPEDLAYLVANVRRVAASRLAEAFPQVDGEDALRNEIEAHVNDVRCHRIPCCTFFCRSRRAVYYQDIYPRGPQSIYQWAFRSARPIRVLNRT